MEDKTAKKSESAFGEPYRVRQNKTHEFFYCCRCHRDRRTNPIYYADSDKNRLFCADCYSHMLSAGIRDAKKKAREEKRAQIVEERVARSPRPSYRPILVTGFLTRTTIKGCAAASHDIEDIQVAVKVLHKNYTVTVEIVPALHCKTCNKYYLLETEYQELKAKGILLCNVVEQSYWSSSQKSGFYITNQESLLHKMGYSVSANNSLLMSERHSILRAALDNGLLTKAEILSHLDYLIRRSRNQAALNTAVEKWKDDREYVRGLSKNAEGVYYEADRIVHRRYNRVIK